jgi:hypothetical protein
MLEVSFDAPERICTHNLSSAEIGATETIDESSSLCLGLFLFGGINDICQAALDLMSLIVALANKTL